MNITLKGFLSLSRAEIMFIFAMMKTYGGLKIDSRLLHDANNSNRNNNKKNNRNKNKNRPKKKKKITNNQDNYATKEPC